MKLVPRGPVTRWRVSNYSTTALTPTQTLLGAGGERYRHGHHQQQHTAGAGQHPATLRRPGTGEVDNDRQTDRQTEYRQSDIRLDTGGADPLQLDWAQGLQLLRRIQRRPGRDQSADFPSVCT